MDKQTNKQTNKRTHNILTPWAPVGAKNIVTRARQLVSISARRCLFWDYWLPKGNVCLSVGLQVEICLIPRLPGYPQATRFPIVTQGNM